MLFSTQWPRTGIFVVGTLSLIAWICRKSIWNFFYPSNHTPPQKPIPRKFAAAQIPNPVTVTYQGSNAEYIVFKENGAPLTEQEYLDLALPILKLQFPRNKGVEKGLSPKILDQLDENEVKYIDKALETEGLKAIKIPKSLYDIFYIAFRFSISASSLKEGDACPATASLEGQFLEPLVDLYRCHPEGNKVVVQEEAIHKVFVRSDWGDMASKVDAGLNNYIFQDLTLKKYTQETLSWEAIISVVDDLFQRIEIISQANKEQFNGLYDQRCPATKCKVLGSKDYLGHWNHYVFRMSDHFASSQTLILTVFKKALWLEFSQGSSVYTCYRGGKQEMEQDQTAPVLHSRSYGHSLCSSCESDSSHMGGAEAIPVKNTREYGYAYAVSLDKADYRKGFVGHFFFIPPAQRTARFRLEGEFTHVRTRVHQPKSPEETIHGMQNTASSKVPYIVTAGIYATRELFEQELCQYLDRHTYSLTE
jgi:hypothetical protein